MQSRKGVETHNCRTSREHGLGTASWTRTYRFLVMEYCGVEPNEIKHRGVPVLRHS